MLSIDLLRRVPELFEKKKYVGLGPLPALFVGSLSFPHTRQDGGYMVVIRSYEFYLLGSYVCDAWTGATTGLGKLA